MCFQKLPWTALWKLLTHRKLLNGRSWEYYHPPPPPHTLSISILYLYFFSKLYLGWGQSFINNSKFLIFHDLSTAIYHSSFILEVKNYKYSKNLNFMPWKCHWFIPIIMTIIKNGKQQIARIFRNWYLYTLLVEM